MALEKLLYLFGARVSSILNLRLFQRASMHEKKRNTNRTISCLLFPIAFKLNDVYVSFQVFISLSLIKSPSSECLGVAQSNI